MNHAFHVVIPARMGSTRFFGKPLADIAGRAMVLRVVEHTLAVGADSVIVATDHEAIFKCVTDAGYLAHMTDTDHPSGTDRIAQVAVERDGMTMTSWSMYRAMSLVIEPDLIAAGAVCMLQATASCPQPPMR